MSALRISRPGAPVELVRDVDPDANLTARQREVLETVRAFGGNRSRAARHLGVPVQAVQDRIRSAKQAGARVPASRTGRPGGARDLGARAR